MNTTITPQTPTMSHRVSEHGLTMKAERITNRPDKSGDQWDASASHFRVTLSKGSLSMSTYYSMGSAHLANYIREQIKSKGLPYHITPKDAEKALRKVVSIHDEQVYAQLVTRYGAEFAPKIEDVLDSLTLDASCYENARNFEDFCSEFGYDTDSRKAEGTYKACGEIAKELRHLIGRDGYDALLNNTERQ
jgi:hypothetical protein